MSQYELSEEDAHYIARMLHSKDSPQSMELRDRIIGQIPIPVPVKFGAVVLTVGAVVPIEQPVVFVRWVADHATHSPWIMAGNHEIPYRTDEIGRITEVLSPGVDVP